MPKTPFRWPGRRSNDPGHDQVVAFLVLDIQHSPAWAEQLAEQIAAVKSGQIPSWERVGNAYRLLLSPEGALIEDLTISTARPQRVPLSELEEAVEAWKAAIR
jgi:hypothetical protein